MGPLVTTTTTTTTTTIAFILSFLLHGVHANAISVVLSPYKSIQMKAVPALPWSEEHFSNRQKQSDTDTDTDTDITDIHDLYNVHDIKHSIPDDKELEEEEVDVKEILKDNEEEMSDYNIALGWFESSFRAQYPRLSEYRDEQIGSEKTRAWNNRLREKYGIDPGQFAKGSLESDPEYRRQLKEFNKRYLKDFQKRMRDTKIRVEPLHELLKVAFQWTAEHPDHLILTYAKEQGRGIYRTLLEQNHPFCNRFIPTRHTPSFSFQLFGPAGYQIGGSFRPLKTKTTDPTERVVLDVSKKWHKSRKVKLSREQLGMYGSFKKNRAVRVVGWVRTCWRWKKVLETIVFVPDAPETSVPFKGLP